MIATEESMVLITYTHLDIRIQDPAILEQIPMDEYQNHEASCKEEILRASFSPLGGHRHVYEHQWDKTTQLLLPSRSQL